MVGNERDGQPQDMFLFTDGKGNGGTENQGVVLFVDSCDS